MKVRHLIIVTMFGCFASAIAEASSVRILNIHIPPGYDDNDQIEVTLDGYLHDCERLAQPEVTVEFSNTLSDRHKINIKQNTRKAEPCLISVVPFTSTVVVNEYLPAGKYKVIAENVVGEFEVKAATVGAVDEHPYAPIDSVNIEQDPISKKFYAVLRGRWQESCIEFDGTILPKKVGTIIEILPTVRINQSSDCWENETLFVKRVELPSNLVEGHYLVHVRSMSGASFNVLHVVYP